MDLEVRNDDTVTAERPPPPLSFEETRTQPFLDGDASEYFCTIARFTLQTGNSLPVFIPIINTNQPPFHLERFPYISRKTRPSTRSLCGSSPTQQTLRLHASVSLSP